MLKRHRQALKSERRRPGSLRSPDGDAQKLSVEVSKTFAPLHLCAFAFKVFCVEFLFAAKAFHSPGRPARMERAGGEFVRNPHIERQAALQFDLPVKQMNCFGSRQPKMIEYVFNLALEAGLHPGTNGGGFAHGTNVALLW